VEFEEGGSEMVDYVYGLVGGEEGDDSAIAEKAQVAVIGYDVNGTVPGYLGRGGLAGADVVVGADVAAVETYSGAETEHEVPGGGIDVVEECEGYGFWRDGDGRGRVGVFFFVLEVWKFVF
jgi:hypothetical protein